MIIMKIIEELKAIKEIAKKDIQETVNRLISYALFLEDQGLTDSENDIWAKYVIGEDISNGGDLRIYNNRFYEYEKVEGNWVVKKITKKSVLNTIKEFENLINEYTTDSYEVEIHRKNNDIIRTIIKNKQAIVVNYIDENSKIIRDILIDSVYDMPFHFEASETDKIYITKVVNGEYVGEKSLLLAC